MTPKPPSRSAWFGAALSTASTSVAGTSMALVLAAILAGHPGTACTAAESGPAGTSSVELQWPWWRGPHSNNAGIPGETPLGPKPRVVWHSTEYTKRTGGTITGNSMTGGCQSLVMHDDKIYCAYYIGSQDPVKFNEERIQHKRVDSDIGKLINGGAGHGSGGIPLKRVGLTDPEVVKRMLWNMHGEDVMVCFDANTGETLWKTVVPGAINSTGPAYGPHLTPSVDPTTGHVYAVGLDGSILAYNGQTGELLWKNTDRLSVLGPYPYGCNRERFEFAIAVDGVVVVSRDQSLKQGDVPKGSRRKQKHGDNLMGLDGATGKVLWTRSGHWMSLPWRHEGTWYLINDGNTCLVPKTGEDLWQLPRESAGNTGMSEVGLNIALDGDRMVCGNACYRISPTGRELLWRNEDLIVKNLYAIVTIDNDICYTDAYDPRNAPAARAALQQEIDAGKAIPKDRMTRALRDHMQKLARHSLQGGHSVGLNMADGSVAVISPPFGAGGGGTHQAATMGGWMYMPLKDGDYYWLDLDAENMGIGDPIDKSKRLLVGTPYGSQTPVCYKGRMYVRSGWSVACLDFPRTGDE